MGNIETENIYNDMDTDNFGDSKKSQFQTELEAMRSQGEIGERRYSKVVKSHGTQGHNKLPKKRKKKRALKVSFDTYLKEIRK